VSESPRANAGKPKDVKTEWKERLAER
jgi:hypothetical protein